MIKKRLLSAIGLMWLFLAQALANSSQFSISGMPCWQGSSCTTACTNAVAESITESIDDSKTASGTFHTAVFHRYCDKAGDDLLQQYKSQGYTKGMRAAWVDTCKKSRSREYAMKSFLNAMAAAIYSDAQNAAINTNITATGGHFLSVLVCILPYIPNLGNLLYDPDLNPNCPIVVKNIKNYMSITIDRSNASSNALKGILNFYANSSGILSCSSYVSANNSPTAALNAGVSMYSTSMSNSAENSISGTAVNISPASLSAPSVSTPIITKPVIYTPV